MTEPRTLLGWTVPANVRLTSTTGSGDRILRCERVPAHGSDEDWFVVDYSSKDGEPSLGRWLQAHAHGGEVVEYRPTPEPELAGCCTACRGEGELAGEPCSDCLTSGHAHNPADLCPTPEPTCVCFTVSEERWTKHYDATEPGSMVEPNPDCPAHFTKADKARVLLGWTVPEHITMADAGELIELWCSKHERPVTGGWTNRLSEMPIRAFLRDHAHDSTPAPEGPAEISSVSPEGETTPGEGDGGRSDLRAAVRAVLAAFNPSGPDPVAPTRSTEFALYLVEQVEAAFLANGWKRFEDYERALTEEIERRDEAEDWADRLAAAIAPPHVVGEHSLKNHPWRNALKWARENRPLSGVELRDAEEPDDWTEEDRFADFRDAYDYATGHFSTAAHAHSKVDRREAYRIWHTIQLGMEKIQHQRAEERDHASEPAESKRTPAPCPAGECNQGMCGGTSDYNGPCGGCCGCLGGCLDAAGDLP